VEELVKKQKKIIEDLKEQLIVEKGWVKIWQENYHKDRQEIKKLRNEIAVLKKQKGV